MNVIEYENYKEKKIHGNPLFPYITYPCSIPLDFESVPMHWHDDIEIIYIKKGCGCVSVDLKNYFVKPNDVFFVLPGHLHSISQLDNNSMEYETILFLPELLLSKNNDICSSRFLTPLFTNELSIDPYICPKDSYYQKIISCIDEADKICQNNSGAYEFAIKSQVFMLFYHLFSCCIKETKSVQTPQHEEKIKQIILFIETNFHKKILISDAASILHFSTSHFMKFFKSAMGCSFISYLNEYRLTMVTRLLTSSEASILDIALECGFDNLSYFNRQFKKKFDTTPFEYRKTHWKGAAF